VADLMGGVGKNGARPGDPSHCRVNWLRDGAYVITALARAGQLELAKQLARPFAEQDFFGGFGSEADGPGLALWALEEVGARVQEIEFDRWLWPHARRKAQLILAMLSATAPLRERYFGPIVPPHRNRDDLGFVCDAARHG